MPPKPCFSAMRRNEKGPDHIKDDSRQEPGQQRLDQPARRHAGDLHALGRQLGGEIGVNAVRHERLLAIRQRLLQRALDGVLTDSDRADLALRGELLELAKGDRLNLGIARPNPLQQQHAADGGQDIPNCDFVFAAGRLRGHGLFHSPTCRAQRPNNGAPKALAVASAALHGTSDRLPKVQRRPALNSAALPSAKLLFLSIKGVFAHLTIPPA